MAEFTYDKLKEKYGYFNRPLALVWVNGKQIGADKKNLLVSAIEVENTAGYEASIATVTIGNTYDMKSSGFRFNEVKKYIFIGSPIVIELGYGTSIREVFRGVITRVNFRIPKSGFPHVEVTAMDVKGLMMANCYSRQLKATTHIEAVKEILDQAPYSNLQQGAEKTKVITKLDIPKPMNANASAGNNEPSAKTIEMVAESDYEFVVKIAKKYNYDFFTVGGVVYFREAKSNSQVLMEVGAFSGLHSLDVGYDITGLVGKVDVRAMDPGKGKAITSVKKISNKISQGNKAKKLVAKSTKVYLDASVDSKEEADNRVKYLVEDISYRFGSIRAELIGLPELTPGRFIEVKSLGQGVDNKFYLTSVRHVLDDDGYNTFIEGKAATM